MSLLFIHLCVLQKRKNNCIAVIGDGAITGGMAYEAMNHAGFLDTNMIVVLNDNQQVRRVNSLPVWRLTSVYPGALSPNTVFWRYQTLRISLCNML